MRRVVLFCGVTALVVWLIGPEPMLRATGGPLALGTSTQQGETYPFYICVGYQCIEQPGCGTSTCDNDQQCGACNATQRANCPSDWHWHDAPDCWCEPPACADGDAQRCTNLQGEWHEDGCWCDHPCESPEPRAINTIFEWYGEWCESCYLYCSSYTVWHTYQLYCADGRSTGDPWDEPEYGEGCTWFPDLCGMWCEV